MGILHNLTDYLITMNSRRREQHEQFRRRIEQCAIRSDCQPPRPPDGEQTVCPRGRTRATIFATNGTTASATLSPSSPSLTAQPPSSLSSTSTSDAFANSPHCTSDGLLSPIVDPLNVGAEGGMSPGGRGIRACAPCGVARLVRGRQPWRAQFCAALLPGKENYYSGSEVGGSTHASSEADQRSRKEGKMR